MSSEEIFYQESSLSIIECSPRYELAISQVKDEEGSTHSVENLHSTQPLIIPSASAPFFFRNTRIEPTIRYFSGNFIPSRTACTLSKILNNTMPSLKIDLVLSFLSIPLLHTASARVP